MLSPRPPTTPTPSWRTELKQAIRAPRVLGEFLELPEAFIAAAELAVRDGFPFLVPWHFAHRMHPKDVHDPLLLQVWPIGSHSLDKVASNSPAPSALYSADPVGDQHAVVADGLLHKYQGRVLMITTGACAIHCRYCFRQNFSYSDVPHRVEDWQPAIDYIRNDDSITEVILSGGDPLAVVDSVLRDLVLALQTIPHLTRLRLHTRLPIVLPSRINDEFESWFADNRFARWLVIHANHAQEFDADVKQAIQRLRSMNCTVLNQCVLLRGINDSVNDQQQLCEQLVNLGVLPYYLHQLDRVNGAERFEVDEAEGVSIIETLKTRLPGYAVPKYVRELAGQPSKTAIK